MKRLAAKAFDTYESLAAVVAKAILSEKECRADKKCLAARAEKKFVHDVVVPLCQAMWSAKDAELMIAQEKANPAGVVDLAELHRQGNGLRFYRQQIAALKPLYRKARGHDLGKWEDEPACVQEASTPEP